MSIDEPSQDTAMRLTVKKANMSGSHETLPKAYRSAKMLHGPPGHDDEPHAGENINRNTIPVFIRVNRRSTDYISGSRLCNSLRHFEIMSVVI